MQRTTKRRGKAVHASHYKHRSIPIVSGTQLITPSPSPPRKAAFSIEDALLTACRAAMDATDPIQVDASPEEESSYSLPSVTSPSTPVGSQTTSDPLRQSPGYEQIAQQGHPSLIASPDTITGAQTTLNPLLQSPDYEYFTQKGLPSSMVSPSTVTFPQTAFDPLRQSHDYGQPGQQGWPLTSRSPNDPITSWSPSLGTTSPVNPGYWPPDTQPSLVYDGSQPVEYQPSIGPPAQSQTPLENMDPTSIGYWRTHSQVPLSNDDWYRLPADAVSSKDDYTTRQAPVAANVPAQWPVGSLDPTQQTSWQPMGPTYRLDYPTQKTYWQTTYSAPQPGVPARGPPQDDSFAQQENYESIDLDQQPDVPAQGFSHVQQQDYQHMDSVQQPAVSTQRTAQDFFSDLHENDKKRGFDWQPGVYAQEPAQSPFPARQEDYQSTGLAQQHPFPAQDGAQMFDPASQVSEEGYYQPMNPPQQAAQQMGFPASQGLRRSPYPVQRGHGLMVSRYARSRLARSIENRPLYSTTSRSPPFGSPSCFPRSRANTSISRSNARDLLGYGLRGGKGGRLEA